MARRIGFLGPVGTYTEEAALRYDPEADLQPFPTIGAVGLAVSSAITQEGVVPIENSLEGSVTNTLDLLISQSDLSIRQEVVLSIDHYLMASPGTRSVDIQVIYSHPQALAQCRDFLERRFPNAQQMASLSTVAAVSDMSASSVPAAAIAPGRAADIHDVEIIGRSIQDNSNNVTRFVVLANEDHPPTGKDKTSICFAFDEDSPGLLYQALGEFAQRSINLVKVESAPHETVPGTLHFLDRLRRAPGGTRWSKKPWRVWREPVSMLKVLGSYPRWDSGGQK